MLKSWMKDKGWSELTPIQQIGFSTIYSGGDCVLEAPTAGGKTEAVFFPVLSREAINKTDSIQVLYLAPLRALLNNVELRILEYSRVCGLRAFKWHGDVDNRRKWEEFNSPSHILMTTPESYFKNRKEARAGNSISIIIAGGRNLFAVFETGPMYEVFEGRNHVGSLDSGFVETLCKEMPFFFVLAGILWKAEKVNLEGGSGNAKSKPGR